MPTTSKGSKKIRHWKHGWIPISPEAKAFVAGRGPRPTSGRSSSGVIPRNSSLISERFQRDAGFTYDPRKGGLIEPGTTTGFAVARPGTTEIIGYEKVNADDFTRADFIKGVSKVMTKHRKALAAGAVLGGWYDPSTNAYMVQVSDIFPGDQKETALKAAQERGQSAVFDFETGDTVFTPNSTPLRVASVSAGSDRMTEFETALSAEHRAAAQYYTGPGFRPMNASLRFGAPLPLSVRAYMDHLDETIDSSRTTRSMMVYRVMDGSWLPPKYEPGDVLTDKGYMSTGVDIAEDYVGDTEWHIRVPKGYPALDLNAYDLSHHSNERELLLKRGTQLRVLSDQQKDGKRIMEFEVVVDDA